MVRNQNKALACCSSFGYRGSEWRPWTARKTFPTRSPASASRYLASPSQPQISWLSDLPLPILFAKMTRYFSGNWQGNWLCLREVLKSCVLPRYTQPMTTPKRHKVSGLHSHVWPIRTCFAILFFSSSAISFCSLTLGTPCTTILCFFWIPCMSDVQNSSGSWANFW